MKTPTFKEFMTLDWKSIEPLYQYRQEIELTQDTLDRWMGEWSDLRKLVDERYARLSLATELNTTDEVAEKEYHDFLENIYPATQSADQKLKEKLLASKLVPAGMESDPEKNAD